MAGWPNRREYPWSEDQPAPWAPGPGYEYGRVAHWGEELGPNDSDWCGHIAELRPPAPADSYQQSASPYGLVNVIGNVAEWVRVAATGDRYEDAEIPGLEGAGIDILSQPFTSESVIDVLYYQISYGMNAQYVLDREGTGVILRERTLGFRCAYPH